MIPVFHVPTGNLSRAVQQELLGVGFARGETDASKDAPGMLHHDFLVLQPREPVYVHVSAAHLNRDACEMLPIGEAIEMLKEAQVAAINTVTNQAEAGQDPTVDPDVFEEAEKEERRCLRNHVGRGLSEWLWDYYRAMRTRYARDRNDSVAGMMD